MTSNQSKSNYDINLVEIERGLNNGQAESLSNQKRLNYKHLKLLEIQKDLDRKQSIIIQKNLENNNSQERGSDRSNQKIIVLWLKLKLTFLGYLSKIKSKLRSIIKEKIENKQDKQEQQNEPVKIETKFVSDYKESLSRLYKIALDTFLASNTKLKFKKYQSPKISIILVLYNRAELTFQCLRSLAEVVENYEYQCEIVMVDNASSDRTSLLLDRIEGLNVIRNSENLNFLLAVNQAAKVAKGEYLLLLNNDVQVLPGTIKSAVKTITSAEDIGAVGGKLILLNGTLQEAGSIVWQDGSCLGYGRGDNPLAPPYMFQRDVDYCSGAFLLTSRQLFLDNGGFDEDYKPAYYEETDYCLRLWQQGKRVVYDPNAALLHYEFASSRSKEAAILLQQSHQKVLVKKHLERLKNHILPDLSNILSARSANRDRPKVLLIDDRVPHSFLGSGFPRSRDILQSLVSFNCLVTFYPLNFPQEDWQTIYQDIPKVVEVMIDYGKKRLEAFFQERAKFYDAIIISRPHNMEIVRSVLTHHPEWFAGSKTKIIYDAEAIYSLRDVQQRRLSGDRVLEQEIQLLVQQELELAKNADTIIAVSDRERQYFLESGFDSVFTLGHTVSIEPTQNCFENRQDILFVGAIHADNSPNADSVFWFVEHILPQIQEKLNSKFKFIIAGFNSSQKVFDLQSDSVEVLGRVEDLAQLYDRARIFVAPTRFAAGIPFKVHHATAHGLPTVTTSLIASQLGWQDETELLVGDDATTFADRCVRLYDQSEVWQRLRESALKKLASDCCSETFINQLKNIL